MRRIATQPSPKSVKDSRTKVLLRVRRITFPPPGGCPSNTTCPMAPTAQACAAKCGLASCIKNKTDGSTCSFTPHMCRDWQCSAPCEDAVSAGTGTGMPPARAWNTECTECTSNSCIVCPGQLRSRESAMWTRYQKVLPRQSSPRHSPAQLPEDVCCLPGCVFLACASYTPSPPWETA